MATLYNRFFSAGVDVSKYTPYNERVTLEKRLRDTEHILKKYPDHVPILVEKRPDSQFQFKQQKFLARNNITVGEFLITLRKHLIGINEKRAVYLFCENHDLAPSSTLIGQLYKSNKSPDGYLVFVCEMENVFG